MQQVELAEAQRRLQDLVDAAIQGETVLIRSEGVAVQLVPLEGVAPRAQFGSAKGLIELAEDFDAPLADFDAYSR
jgi:antitoxin (DNA-binding transcriptional repressor) of toxin-antitoxin stability system